MIVSDLEDGVRELRLHRPERRNTFDRQLMGGLARALSEAEEDPRIRCLVVSATAPDFSAGWDRDELSEPDPVLRRRTSSAYAEMMDVFERSTVPIIAAVRGAAVGIGFTILGHCDLVILGSDARMRAPFAALGLVPEGGSSVLLPAALGHHLSAELLLTGRWLGSAEAIQCGFGNLVVVPDAVDAEARDMATRVARAPLAAVRATKRLLLDGRRDAARAARMRESERFRCLGDAGAGA